MFLRKKLTNFTNNISAYITVVECCASEQVIHNNSKAIIHNT